MKQIMVVSFSGGKTSAFMARWLQQTKSDEYDLKYLFANTGKEDAGTLDFVKRCAKEWCMDIVWLEAEVNHEHGKGTRHKVVTFNTASTNAEPFEAVIKKYGIPNQAYPHCTREMKLAPINSYVKSMGWGDRLMAVGIRADEVDRMSVQATANAIVYPLISMHPTTRDDVDLWFESQPFNLTVPEHRGNCLGCFKKSYRKNITTLIETPGVFDFYERMERNHGLSGSNEDGTKRVFFRKHTSALDLRRMASRPDFKPFKPSTEIQRDMFWDAAGGCSESCDVFAE